MEDVNNKPAKTNSGFTKRMTGMLNSIKDALPTFEDDSQHGKSKNNFRKDKKYISKCFLQNLIWMTTNPLFQACFQTLLPSQTAIKSFIILRIINFLEDVHLSFPLRIMRWIDKLNVIFIDQHYKQPHFRNLNWRPF